MSKTLQKFSNTPEKVRQIIEFLNDGEGRVTLNKDLEQLLERYMFMDGLINKYRRTSICIERQMKRWDISKNTAVKDYNETKEVFNSTPKNTKRYDFNFLMELSYMLLDEAREDRDHRAASAYLKVIWDNMQKHWAEDEQPVDIPEPALFAFSADAKILGIIPKSEKDLAKLLKIWTQSPIPIDNIQESETIDGKRN